MDNSRMTTIEMIQLAQSGEMLDILARRIGWHAGPLVEENLFHDSKKFRAYMEAPETVEPLLALKSTLTAMPAFARPEQPLAIDAQGCIYLQACNPDVDMIQLITPLVNIFREKSGRYPAKIELCERRWIFGQLLRHFETSDGTLIPYELGSDDRYDAVCRSLPLRR